jgi:hypothetical protein
LIGGPDPGRGSRPSKASWSSVWFVLSGTALSGLVSMRGRDLSFRAAAAYVAASMAAGFVVSCVLALRCGFPRRIVAPAGWRLRTLALVLTAIAVPAFVQIASPRIQLLTGTILAARAGGTGLAAPAVGASVWVLGAGSAFAVFVFLCSFLRALSAGRRCLGGWSRAERVYSIGFVAVMAVVVVLAFRQTSAFYHPVWNGTLVPYDVIFSSDSGDLVDTNVYLKFTATENEIRQPLFGVFAAPFALPALAFAWLFRSVPNAYVLGLAFVQLLLLAACAVMTSRLVGVSRFERWAFLGVFALSYPTLLFSVVMEQYVVTVFWLLLFVCTSAERPGEGEDSFVGAAGCLVSNLALFPLLVRGRPWREWIRAALKVAGVLLAIFLLAGQLGLVAALPQYLRVPLGFGAHSVSFGDRLLQYSGFVRSCVIAPIACLRLPPEGFPAFRQAIPGGVSIVGLAVAALSCVGGWFHRRRFFARVAAAWCLYSFLLLGAWGWGASENGMVLYSLYFSWAFTGLSVLGLSTLMERYRAGKWIVLAVLLVILSVLNARGLVDLVRFGHEYYPAPS